MTALLLLSLNVHANGVIAETPNQGGGSIALLDMECKAKDGTFVAYSYLKTGQSMLGCWTTDGDARVFINWSDGDLRSYPIDMFKIKKKLINGKWL
jgi:hypothetical protein